MLMSHEWMMNQWSLFKRKSLYHCLKDICQTGGFKLNKCICNNRMVLAAIQEEEKVTEMSEFGSKCTLNGKGYWVCNGASCQINSSSELPHYFANASEVGYGTLTYWVQQNSSNLVHFCVGKGKSCPPTANVHLSFGAHLAVRVDRMLRKELQLPFEDSIYSTDSTTVLKYISSETLRFCTFLANRVSAIQQTSTDSQ